MSLVATAYQILIISEGSQPSPASSSGVVQVIIALIGIVGTIVTAWIANRRKQEKVEASPPPQVTPQPNPSELVVAQSVASAIEDYRERIAILQATLDKEREKSFVMSESRMSKIADLERQVAVLSVRVEVLSEEIKEKNADIRLLTKDKNKLAEENVQLKAKILEQELRLTELQLKDIG